LKRLLILGGDGMLGHQLLKTLSMRHDARVSLRQPLSRYASYGLFTEANSFPEVVATDRDRLTDILGQFRPHVVINAVGIVKQRAAAKDAVPSLEVNSLLPHRLVSLASLVGARVIHFSTDCVFSGLKGDYSEADAADAADLYGRTKLLGEISYANALTLRTSIIGRELGRNASLVEWFLGERGTVRGFRRAIYTGFTTLEMSRIVEMLITQHPQAHGLWHVSSDKISKYALLLLLRKHYGLDTQIIPDDEFACDRSLDSSRFRTTFGYTPPSWEQMIAELAAP
jgi:dTDP-4-dehydrorhamnose reductase